MKTIRKPAALAATAALAVSLLSGCSMTVSSGADTGSAGSAPTTAVTQTTAAAPITTTSTKADKTTAAVTTAVKAETYTSADGKPPVSADLKKFYAEALELYRGVSCGMLSSSTDYVQIGEQQYTRVTDKRFDSVAELRTYMLRYFTADLADEVLNAKLWNVTRYTDYEGHLYQLGFGRGGNLLYAGHVFGTARANADTMEWPATAYYVKEAGGEQPDSTFYVAPENQSLYDTKEYTFRLTKTGDGWRFTSFYLFY